MMTTGRRIGLGVGLLVITVALLWWRHRDRDEASVGAPTATAKVPASGSTVGREIHKAPDPRTQQRGSIAGTVRDEAKAPIASARVCIDGWAKGLDDDELKDPICLTTDAQGAFKAEKLYAAHYVVTAGAKAYRPEAFHPGGNRHKTEFTLAPGEAKTGVNIVLRAGGAELTGTVSDISGGPIAHARVTASVGRWGEGASTPSVETDDKGVYTVWTVPGMVRLAVIADGYASNRSATGRAPGTLDVLLTPESGLSGTVVDANTGAPIAGAVVNIEAAQWSWDGHAGETTNAQGTFRVHHLPPGRYFATAQTEHGYGRTEGSVLVGLGQQVDGVIVKVFPASQIIGKVMIEGPTPELCVEGSVWFRDEGNDRWVASTTEPDGTIHANGVLPGTYTAQVSCDGYRAKEHYPPVIVVAGKDLVDQTWEVEIGSTLRGKVLGKSGQPIEDAQVSAQTTGGDARAKSDWSSDRSLADGSYELRGLRAATYKLEIETHKAVAPREGFKVVVPGGGTTVQQDLVLEDGGTIKGVVVDAQGKPVDDVTVDARAFADRMWWNQEEIKSDAKGEFAIEALRAGDYRVLARRGWGNELRKPGSTDDDTQGEKVAVAVGKIATVRLVVETQTGTIKGTVVDASGAPVSDAFLSTARESDAAGAQDSGARGTRDWWGDDQKPVLTGVDGAFVVGKLSPGKYTLRAYRKGGGEALAEHVAVGTTARLQIKPTGSIEGVAKRDAGPLPPELTISVEDLKTGFSRTETFFRTDGRFTVHDLPAGHFTLTARAEGGQAKTEVELAEGQTKAGVTVTLEQLVTLIGRVVDSVTKQPVAGMMLFARPAVGSQDFSFAWGEDDNDHITDAAGAFTLKRVARGKLAIQGMAKEWKESEYTWFRVFKEVTGTGTIDLGDLPVMKKRIKEGQTAGELGLHFKEAPPDQAPEDAKLEVSFIEPRGPCAKQDIKVGDVIAAIDGVDVLGGNTMHAWTLMNAPVGTKLTIGLARGTSFSVTLAAP